MHLTFYRDSRRLASALNRFAVPRALEKVRSSPPSPPRRLETHLRTGYAGQTAASTASESSGACTCSADDRRRDRRQIFLTLRTLSTRTHAPQENSRRIARLSRRKCTLTLCTDMQFGSSRADRLSNVPSIRRVHRNVCQRVAYYRGVSLLCEDTANCA